MHHCNECNYIKGHAEYCKLYDAKRELTILLSRVNTLEAAIDGGFEVTLGHRRNEGYFIELKHPDQEEKFMSETVIGALVEFDEWWSECEGMQ